MKETIKKGAAISLDGIKAISRSPNPLTLNDFTLEDPFNIAPVGDILFLSAQDMLAAMPPDQILVIIMSKIHTVPIHKMAQIDLLSRLKAAPHAAPDPARTFMFAHETPYNSLSSLSSLSSLNSLEYRAQHTYGIPIPDSLKGRLHEYDRDGHMALRDELDKRAHDYAPQSCARVFNYALRSNISTLFNDAGRVFGDRCRIFLDPAYPAVTAQITQKHLQRNIEYFSTVGIEIRNEVMVERALQHAKKAGTRIVVQDCGALHIYGNKQEHSPYQNSLTGLYKTAGCRTIGVFFSSKAEDGYFIAENMIPDRALADNPDAIIIRGTATDEFQAFDRHSAEALALSLEEISREEDRESAAELTHIANLAKAYNSSSTATPCPFGTPPEPIARSETEAAIRAFIDRAMTELSR